MAPPRKRGAKGAKTKSELSLGDLVLAKVKGFPPWPAKISRAEDWERTPDPKKYFVQFFGTAEIAFVAPADIQAFTSEAKNKLSARCQGKTVKYFAQAVKEICEEFGALQKKNSSGVGDDSDRSTPGCDAPSVDGAVDSAVEVDLKNGIGTNETRGEIEVKGTGLERCSLRLGDINWQDIKPAISSNANDSSSPVTSSKKKNKLCSDGAKIPKLEVVSGSSPCNFSCPKEEVSCDSNTEDTRNTRTQLGHVKHTLVSYEVSHPAKRLTSSDLVDDATRGLLKTYRQSDCQSHSVVEGKADNAEIKKPALRGEVENRLASRAQTGSVDANTPSDEDGLPPTKRRRWALEATSGSSTYEGKAGKGSAAFRSDLSCSGNVKSSVTPLHTKRRAVRLYGGDDDDEPRTPIHAGSVKKVHAHSHVSEYVKNTDAHVEGSIHDRPCVRDSGILENGPSKELIPPAKLNGSSSPNPQQTVEKRPKKSTDSHAVLSPGNLGPDKVSSAEAKPVLFSPNNSPFATKPVFEPHKANKSSAKVSGSVSQKKVPTGPYKGSEVVSNALNYTRNQATIEKSKPISSGERQKSTPKSNLRVNDSSLVAGNPMECKSLSIDRLEAGREDKTSSMIDTQISDSVTSMKHLIAAAQAKRRQALSQSLSHGNASSVFVPTTDISGGSPSPAPAVQRLQSSSSIVVEPDSQGYYPHSSLASPSSHARQISSNYQPDNEEIEERRVSSGHRPAGGSLSGGTEAAVARDAFEGMIETLSRTKESIGRATRLAIDCAKYGIANE
ncbi:unnamed protein product, partial [Ilex paraguariensis]